MAYQTTATQLIAGLGAAGVAVQNVIAVDLFLRSVIAGGAVMTPFMSGLTQAVAIGAGGVCSGMVNFWMNQQLLADFFQRMSSNTDYYYKQLSGLEQLQYFSGIAAFVMTGVLFGLMAFTFGMKTPFAALAIASGVFVALIMTIQEVETWLNAFNPLVDKIQKERTLNEKIGRMVGHLIAIGNVFALSLLFTLGLAESLMALHVAAFNALLIGLLVAFTFGAFTEFYFYNTYLASYCEAFLLNLAWMQKSHHATLGFLCAISNAFVNGALTYSGIELLTGFLIAANMTVPPLGFITALAMVSAVFGGSASFILGMNFWAGNRPDESSTIPVVAANDSHLTEGVHSMGFFSPQKETRSNHSPARNEVMSR